MSSVPGWMASAAEGSAAPSRPVSGGPSRPGSKPPRLSIKKSIVKSDKHFFFQLVNVSGDSFFADEKQEIAFGCFLMALILHVLDILHI